MKKAVIGGLLTLSKLKQLFAQIPAQGTDNASDMTSGTPSYSSSEHATPGRACSFLDMCQCGVPLTVVCPLQLDLAISTSTAPLQATRTT